MHKTLFVAPGDVRFSTTLQNELTRRRVPFSIVREPKLDHFARGDCLVIPASDTEKSVDDAKRAIAFANEHVTVAVVMFGRNAFAELCGLAAPRDHAHVFKDLRLFAPWAAEYALSRAA